MVGSNNSGHNVRYYAWLLRRSHRGASPARKVRIMTGHVFVDESKNRDYLVAASVVQPDDLVPARRVVSGLLLKGQSRLHMKKENRSRRRS